MMANEPEKEIANVVPEVPEKTTFPPYPPYEVTPAPPSVADTIIAGCDLRYLHKSTLPQRPVYSPPRPAGPGGPKATDVKLPKQALKAHLRCMRTHGNVLTDRLERISKPQRRRIINLWREYAEMLPPETIARLRAMLDADEPFKPEQAYQYFMNLRKTKKKSTANARIKELKKDILSIYGEKRFLWARNATVAFAKGVQQRLSKPGHCALADGMLRLSDIILHEICGFMHMKKPSRGSHNPKARFMMEIADKIAVWIDEILGESDDRMLMMDFDEDDDILYSGGNIEDDFLDMMDDGLRAKSLLGLAPAYLMFQGPMREVFDILIQAMNCKGETTLVKHGKFEQSYKDGAQSLLIATDLDTDHYPAKLANQVNNDLEAATKSTTPSHLAPHMKDMLDICSKYLSQVAEYNKDKGLAFQLLVKSMKEKGKGKLYQKDKLKKTFGDGAKELEEAKGLESDHDDPNLSQEIHSALKILMENVSIPDNLKTEMADTMDMCSKYLSEYAVDELERGPAFKILIEELEEDGAEPFCDFPALSNKFSTAYTLKTAPGLTSVTPDPKTAPKFAELLHDVVDPATPKQLKKDMNDIATQKLLEMMKSNGKNLFAKSPKYTMDYKTGAMEIETAPALTPYHPIKDISDDGKAYLTKDMENKTPADLKIAMKALISDVAKHLSQPFALRSEIAGPRYPMEFLAHVKRSLGKRPLFKYKTYGQSYGDAANMLLRAGPLTVTDRELEPSSIRLHHEIKSEMNRGVPKQLAPTIAEELHPTMDDASKHLAHIGTAKGRTMEKLVEMMKEKGEASLAKLQGYEQTHSDGARRVETATSFKNPKVEKQAYEKVKGKLSTMTEEKAAQIQDKQAAHMPEMIEMTSKYLAAPVPETDAEKRKVLADMITKGGEKIISEEGPYKMTHLEGASEIQKAKIGVTTAKDEAKRRDILAKIEAVVPDDNMKNILKDPVAEGTAHLADTVQVRGEVMKVIGESLKKEKEKDLLTVGKFQKTHEGGGIMIDTAPHFNQKETPAPVLVDVVGKRVDDAVDKHSAAAVAKFDPKHIKESKAIASKYIAGVATKESGLSPEELAAMEAELLARANETEAERQARLAREKAGGGESEAERLARLPREKGTDKVGETEGERQARLERERKIEEERLARLAADKKRREAWLASLQNTGGQDQISEAERKGAMEIIHKALKGQGDNIFHQDPKVKLTHRQASDWLRSPPNVVDDKVKDSGDTARLAKKFERNLNNLVTPQTSEELVNPMLVVIAECAQLLSEQCVSISYEGQARDAVILQMQNKRNEILVDVNGATETTFFAAQRLKRTNNFKDDSPNPEVAPRIAEKLDDIMKEHSMPRKIGASVKATSKNAADYLSNQVTKPDEHIEAYVALLEKMETTGDKPLIEGQLPKSYEEAATYLRGLVTFENTINRPNAAMKADIGKKMNSMMADVTPQGYTTSALAKIISEQSNLLTSYAMYQAEKNEALKVLVGELEEAGKNVLLRHGSVRKTNKDGADLLRDKNIEQLSTEGADTVIARKIELKINSLMEEATPPRFKPIMPELIKDATNYLAIHLLEPRIIKICKCLKNATVQCELRGEESLRHVSKQPCTCSRHVSVQDVQELGTVPHVSICPGSSRQFSSGIKISVTPCPVKQGNKQPCPGENPSPYCTESPVHYLLHSTKYRNYDDDHPTRIPPSSSRVRSFNTELNFNSTQGVASPDIQTSRRSSTVQSLLKDIHFQNSPLYTQQEQDIYFSGTEASSRSPLSWTQGTECQTFQDRPAIITAMNKAREPQQKPSTIAPSGFSKVYTNNITPASQITMTQNQMGDWHAMIVSLMWNMQAWRKWIQENIDRGLLHHYDPNSNAIEKNENDWIAFQRRVCTEGLQWQQYKIFSHQLTLRLVSRYSDNELNKLGSAPQGAGEKITDTYKECTAKMMNIIDMLHKWTQWLLLVIKETSSVPLNTTSYSALQTKRWHYYKTKIVEYSSDWIKYNLHVKVCWEQKYRSLFVAPGASDCGPVWVVSACGAVPSGAVAAGVYDGEIIWIARTTHKANVLPAALLPSKHCCLVHADGVVCHYTKYQVMCNAEVKWLPWRGGEVSPRAVRAAAGVLIGRVHYRESHLVGPVHAPHYRCHVVIFGRPFAFNCYELLVHAERTA